MRRTTAVLLLLVAACSAFAAPEPPRNEALNALFESEFRNRLEEHPERATEIGIPGYDDRLTDFSPDAVARRNAHITQYARALEGFDPAKLSTQDRISRDIELDRVHRLQALAKLYGDLEVDADLAGWEPVTSMHGPQFSYAALAKDTRFHDVADYENYLKRLAAMPRAMDQVTAQMRGAMRVGWMPPAQAMGKVVGQFAPFADGPLEATPLGAPFRNFPADVPAADRARLAKAGDRVLREEVLPAFARMREFLAATYLPAARKSLAASELPGGPRYYELMVEASTTTRMKPREIHELGLREVARIRGEMERVMRESGFKGTMPQFLEFLRTDPRFFFKTSEERLRAYRDIAKRADAQLPALFAVLPRLPYGVRAMEPYEGDNADHYSPGALDGTRAGYFEANVNHLEARPSHEMESLLLHEAVPGHHLQGARQHELDFLPRFRRVLWLTAYGEGWALYAESLGYEMGFYQDPYSHFGNLTGEMMRACRLVIDTGIHAFGWTREQSIRYLVDNAGLHPDFATAEVDRYIVWPGQALGYKIGQLEIRKLREKAKQALGDRFDVRRFHNAVLDDGPLPLTLLDARIDEWIAHEKEALAR
jgi:uncharacterized protein (DUF885 family)